MRKVVGANRSQLIRQFMGESILLALLALFFAVALVEISLPAFNAFIQRELVLNYTENWHVVLTLLGVVLFAGLALWNLPRLFPLGFSASRGLKKHPEDRIENVQFSQNAHRVSICYFDCSHYWNSRRL